MAYRDDDAPLRERAEVLSTALDQVRAQARALSDEEAELGRELAAVQAKLDADPDVWRRLPLADIRIATPCEARWDDMVGDDRKRFCNDCKKDVHNLTAMTRAEVAAFVEAHARGACVRLYQREDGRMLTADCPVGRRRMRTRNLLVAMLGSTASAMLALTALVSVLATRELGPIEVGGQPDMTPAPLPRVPPPTFASPASPPNAPSLGYVWVDAPEGTRVFEGDRLLGKAPFQFAAGEGTHLLSANHPRTGKRVSAVTVVRPNEIATARIDFDAPQPDKRRLMMGDMRF
jgi:hypothetical protein